MRPPLVKICGIRSVEDARLASELGAAAIGFIFWPDSPRFIDPYRAKRIACALPPLVTTVGVFVDQPAEYVAGVAGLLNLGAVQLHGSEDLAPFLKMGHRIIKAVSVDTDADADATRRVPDDVTVLLDAHDPVRRGGTGRTIDWTSAARLAGARSIILSGGLSPLNVRDAVEQVHPYAVDVSSGVESAPGRKDPDKLRSFFAALDSLSATGWS
jgi:phosphoribosylanthranilate isomerase